MTDEKPKLNLHLDPQRLARIIDTAVVSCTEIVNFHFTSLAAADLSEPAEVQDVVFKIRGPRMTADHRRELHQNWILAKAFQELLRAVRHSLEEAHVICELLTKVHSVKSSMSIADFLKPLQSKAASYQFPELLDAVNNKLDPKLDFAEAYKSLQQARNCLEHRGGVVRGADLRGAEKFTLSIPRIKMFYLRDKKEIEIAAGHVVEPGDGKDSAEILMKLELRKRSIGLGERLSFTLAEFNEAVFACHYLGQQLATKLPKPRVDTQ